MSGPYEQGERESYLEVENGTGEEIAMAFHGNRYVWSPGEKLMLSEAAAAHIFGYGLDDAGKETAFLRLGWINSKPDCNWRDACKKLSQVRFKPVQQVFEMVQARSKSRKKSGASDRSLVGAGVSGGGGEVDPSTPVHPDEAAS